MAKWSAEFRAKMFSSAKWIWIAEDSGERNLTCCARRSFSLKKGRVPASRETICVSWRVEGDVFSMSVILPPGVEAEVCVPEGYEPGRVQIHMSGTTTSPVGFGN